jgi:NTE family protein
MNMETKDVKFILANTQPFSQLSPAARDEFLSFCEVREYRRAEIIYRHGDQPAFFYLLLKGRLTALSGDGQNHPIEVLKRGTCFGVISLFTGDVHSVTVKTAEDSWVLEAEGVKVRAFMSEHQAFSLEFAQLFSQRVRVRLGPKMIFRCTRIAVTGFPFSGKTSYTFSLAGQLRKETRKKTICVEVSLSGDFRLSALPGFAPHPINLKDFKEEELSESTTVFDDTDCLLVRAEDSRGLAELLNVLSERYHFIVYEAPLNFWDTYLDDFAGIADFLHILFSPAGVRESRELTEGIKARNPYYRERIKVILSGFDESDRAACQDSKKYVGQPVYATLSSGDVDAYAKTIRRIARQVGEVTVGLALGSGAAFGYCHIGVLEVLEENNIAVDMVAGTSMGAVIAALWACGFSQEEIREKAAWFGRKMSRFPFTGLVFPFRGLFQARRLEALCRHIFGERTFYELKHPLLIVTFDFLKREARLVDEGPIYKAVAASSAMPGVFEPIRFKKDILLDGGVLNPLPARVLLSQGANKIIAVNITPSPQEVYANDSMRKSFNVLDYIFGSIETMQRQFVQEAIKLSDIVIHPDLANIGWMEFRKIDEFIRRGQVAAREHLAEIKKLVGE